MKTKLTQRRIKARKASACSLCKPWKQAAADKKNVRDLRHAHRARDQMAEVTDTTKPKIEVEREEDGRWMAEATELPGCMVYGKTRADAVAKVKELAEHVFADLPNATLNLEEDSAELEAELLKAADSPVKPMRESELREIADQALREFRTRGVKSAKK